MSHSAFGNKLKEHNPLKSILGDFPSTRIYLPTDEGTHHSKWVYTYCLNEDISIIFILFFCRLLAILRKYYVAQTTFLDYFSKRTFHMHHKNFDKLHGALSNEEKLKFVLDPVPEDFLDYMKAIHNRFLQILGERIVTKEEGRRFYNR